jgi:hypothetical protein
VRARTIAAAAALALLAAPAAALADAPLDDYHSRVVEAMDALYSTSDVEEPAADPEAALDRVRALLPAAETVEFDGGSVAVDNAWLGPMLDAYRASHDPDEREKLLDRVATHLYAIDVHLDALGASSAHAADARAKLDEILARAEFRKPGENPVAKFLRDVRRRVFDFLNDLVQRLFGGGGGGSFATGMRVVIVAAGSLALLLLVRAIAIAVARRGKGGAREKAGKRKKTRTVLGEELDESTTAADIAAAARALAGRGDYRGAIRKLFVALIYGLDERGLVRLRSEATNREYLALVRRLGELYPVMASMTDVFERVWYGEEPVGRAEYDAFESMYTRAVDISTRESAVRS